MMGPTGDECSLEHTGRASWHGRYCTRYKSQENEMGQCLERTHDCVIPIPEIEAQKLMVMFLLLQTMYVFPF